ncbi:MAG: hypothetical protein LBJ45_02565 [Holosporaceae bacterium]|jgi:chromosome segregation ATPase|nr:hypothetical protein [Holosporaceae bacterium]
MFTRLQALRGRASSVGVAMRGSATRSISPGRSAMAPVQSRISNGTELDARKAIDGALDEIKCELLRRRLELGKANSEINDGKKKYDKLQNEFDQAMEKARKLGNRLKTAQGELAGAKKAKEDAEKNLEVLIATAKDHKTSWKDKTNLREAVSVATNKIIETANALEAKEKECEKLEADLAVARTKIEELEKERNDALGKFSATAMSIAGKLVAANVEGAKDLQKKATIGSFVEMQAFIEALDKCLEGYSAALKSVNEENAKLNEKIKVKDEEIKGKDAEIKAKDEEHKKAIEERDAELAANETVKNAKREAEEIVKNAKKEAEKAKEDAEKIKKEAEETVKNANEEAEKAKKEAEKAKEDAEKIKREAKKELANEERRMNELKGRVAEEEMVKSLVDMYLDPKTYETSSASAIYLLKDEKYPSETFAVPAGMSGKKDRLGKIFVSISGANFKAALSNKGNQYRSRMEKLKEQCGSNPQLRSDVFSLYSASDTRPREVVGDKAKSIIESAIRYVSAKGMNIGNEEDVNVRLHEVPGMDKSTKTVANIIKWAVQETAVEMVKDGVEELQTQKKEVQKLKAENQSLQEEGKRRATELQTQKKEVQNLKTENKNLQEKNQSLRAESVKNTSRPTTANTHHNQKK